jgi:hypothetical protein
MGVIESSSVKITGRPTGGNFKRIALKGQVFCLKRGKESSHEKYFTWHGKLQLMPSKSGL